MNIIKDTLGATIKQARLHMELTQEQLAERLGISPRYILLIENSHKKPSYELLFRIIRELNIQSDLIFYPEKEISDFQREALVQLIYRCDNRALAIIKATAQAILENEGK